MWWGVKIMSLGFFVAKCEATSWRGPMLSKVVDQFLSGVEWGELDYLLVDLPPGTGDVQLSLCQKIPPTGAVSLRASARPVPLPDMCGRRAEPSGTSRGRPARLTRVGTNKEKR